MKKQILLLLVFVVGSLANTFAQGSTSTTEIVVEANVPSAVVTSYKAKYATGKIVKWEKRTYTGAAGNTYVKYVAVFDQDGIRNRARYKEDGTGLSTTTYYWFKNVTKLPQAIQDYAKTKYPDYKLTSGEKELSLKSGKYVYRIRVKKGPTQVVVYLNEKGEEVSKDNVDIEILENESETPN